MISNEAFEQRQVPQVLEHVVFELPKRTVILTREIDAFGIPGETWVARSDNGLRHFPDPEFALQRFASPQRAERLFSAWAAFKDVTNTESENPGIEVE